MKHCNIPRLVIWFLGVACICVLVIVAVAIVLGKEIPVAFWAIASNPMTALGAILSTTRPSTPPSIENPVPTLNVNPKDDPVQSVLVDEPKEKQL